MKNKHWIYLIVFVLFIQIFMVTVNADIGNENTPLLPIDIINNNFDWRLQGYNPNTELWVDCNNFVSFELFYQDDDSIKINITFDFQYRTDYRLDLIINKKVLDYVVDNEGHNYTVNYSGKLFYFNFHDMFLHSDEIHHNIIEYEGKQVLWVRFVKYNIQGKYVIDPNMGFSSTSSYYINIKNTIDGMWALYPSNSGWCNEMYAYIYLPSDLVGTRYLSAGLFILDGSDYTLLAEKEVSVTAMGFRPAWKKFVFNESVYLDKNEYYAIVLSANSNTRLYHDEIYPGIRHRIREVVAYDNFNNPWTTYDNSGRMDWCLYAKFEIPTYTFKNYIPIDGTIDKEYDGNFYVNISVNFSCLNLFPVKLDFYSGEIFYTYLGSFNLTSNGTAYINYSVDDYDIKYYWHCKVNGTNNMSNISNFEMDDIEIITAGTLNIDNTQFFYILMLAIWLYLITLAYERDDVLLLYIQFFIASPLFITLFADAFLSGMLLGIGVGITVLTASVYFVFLGTGISFDRKQKNSKK